MIFLLNQKPRSLFLAYIKFYMKYKACACMYIQINHQCTLTANMNWEKIVLKYLKEKFEWKGDSYYITYNHSKHQSTGCSEENAKEKGEHHETNINVERILSEVI